MPDKNQGFVDASIQRDSVRPDPDGGLINLYRISGAHSSVLFQVAYAFAENGSDFWVVVSNFGLPRASLAGSTASLTRVEYTPEEIESARQRIEAHFQGPEEKNYFPFDDAKGATLGVRFVDGWAKAKTTH